MSADLAWDDLLARSVGDDELLTFLILFSLTNLG